MSELERTDARAPARREDRNRALLAGYQIHVSKPVGPAELVAVMADPTFAMNQAHLELESPPS